VVANQFFGRQHNVLAQSLSPATRFSIFLRYSGQRLCVEVKRYDIYEIFDIISIIIRKKDGLSKGFYKRGIPLMPF